MLISISLFSCHNNDNNQVPTPPTYYIEGKVDGVMHRAEYICPYTGCESSSANYNHFMSSVSMQRTTSATNSIGWMISVYDVNLDTWQVPDTMMAGDFNAEYFDFFYYRGPWESDNLFESDNVVLGDSSFVLKVTGKTGDVMEGTFSGKLRNGTYTDSTVTVTEGKFKIHLTRLP